MLTLRYLVGGDSFKILSFCFRIAKNTVSVVVKNTCQMLIEACGKLYLKPPETNSDWIRI